jgi:glycosyltransferase involved in cell wall biosynthesis
LSRPHLSVIVPAYNEAERLGRSLPAVVAYLREAKLPAEIVVVDDGSRDRTAETARSVLRGFPAKVVSLDENRGKGAAVRRGVAEAGGRWLLLSDADLSTPIEEHRKLAEVVRDQDLDVAIGSRGLRDSRIEVRQNLVRQTMGKTFNQVIRLTTGLPFRDTQCGFKLMDRDRVLPLFQRMVVDGFAFDVELLFLCRRFSLAVREVPVVWRNDPRSQVSLLGDPLKMLRDLARVRWRFRRGGYNPSD